MQIPVPGGVWLGQSKGGDCDILRLRSGRSGAGFWEKETLPIPWEGLVELHAFYQKSSPVVLKAKLLNLKADPQQLSNSCILNDGIGGHRFYRLDPIVAAAFTFIQLADANGLAIGRFRVKYSCPLEAILRSYLLSSGALRLTESIPF